MATVTERLRVTVTQEDIDKGGYYSGNCPMARAIQRGREDATVGVGTFVRVEDRVYKHSHASFRFIRRFDEGKPVHPATFILTRKETST